VKTRKIDESFDLNYSRYDNYAIVWTKKNYGDNKFPGEPKYCTAARS
jgi:hypothetical protein